MFWDTHMIITSSNQRRLLWLHNPSRPSLFYFSPPCLPCCDFSSSHILERRRQREPRRERGALWWECIVPVPGQKIDSKFQSLLRAPRRAAWPQNNIQTCTHRATCKHTVHCPTSAIPIQLRGCGGGDRAGSFAICQPALSHCRTTVMCQRRKRKSESDSDVNVITASSLFTATHTNALTLHISRQKCHFCCTSPPKKQYDTKVN